MSPILACSEKTFDIPLALIHHVERYQPVFEFKIPLPFFVLFVAHVMEYVHTSCVQDGDGDMYIFMDVCMGKESGVSVR